MPTAAKGCLPIPDTRASITVRLKKNANLPGPPTFRTAPVSTTGPGGWRHSFRRLGDGSHYRQGRLRSHFSSRWKEYLILHHQKAASWKESQRYSQSRNQTAVCLSAYRSIDHYHRQWQRVLGSSGNNKRAQRCGRLFCRFILLMAERPGGIHKQAYPSIHSQRHWFHYCYVSIRQEDTAQAQPTTQRKIKFLYSNDRVFQTFSLILQLPLDSAVQERATMCNGVQYSSTPRKMGWRTKEKAKKDTQTAKNTREKPDIAKK